MTDKATAIAPALAALAKNVDRLEVEIRRKRFALRVLIEMAEKAIAQPPVKRKYVRRKKVQTKRQMAEQRAASVERRLAYNK